MKLSFLDPTSKLATNITNFSRKFRLNVITRTPVETPSLAIITDGTPDDLVFAMISHRLDGDKTIAVLKPNIGTRDGAIDLIPTYLQPHTKNILLIMDQESEPLEILFERCLRKLREKGWKNTENHGKRLKVYKCELGNKEFAVILAINGVDDVATDNHCIEDHLVKFVGLECEGDSKAAWNSLPRTEKEEVFKNLLECKDLETVFPQQFKAGQMIKT